MSDPYWQLSPPYWQLSAIRSEGRRPSLKHGPSTIYRVATPAPELIERASAEGGAILDVRFALFDVWQEIDSPTEGRFLERIRRGAFAKSIKESLRNVRALLSHGKDPSLGEVVLGKIASIQERADAAVARVELFRSVPPLLLDGLEAGEYGASFRGRAIKSRVDWHPGRSDFNPEGLPEITRLEIALKDVGPTPFAAYEGTSAQIQTAGDALVPARSRPAGRVELERPYWSLATSTTTRSLAGSSTEGGAMAARSRAGTNPGIRDFIEQNGRVVALDSFHPRGGSLIERGRFYKLSDPAVETWPDKFALCIPLDAVLGEKKEWPRRGEGEEARPLDHTGRSGYRPLAEIEQANRSR